VARIDAANALAEKPSHAVVQALRERLRREPFWGVQQRIARALGKIGGKAARDALIAGLGVENPKARRAVVEALGTFKDDPQAARALERLARAGDPSYYVEGELARALGRCRAPKAIELLRAYLDKPSHVEVIRSGAYDGLAELADPETLPLIEAGLRYGAPALARPAAIRAVAELGRRHQHLRARAIELLGPVAEHKDQPSATFRGKMAALRAFEKLGDLDATPILRRVAAGEVDGRIVRLAKQTIEALRKQASKPAELGALRTDVDQITKENKALRDRLEALERKPKSPAPKRGRSRTAQ
jgi:aminopeptidase N